MDFELKHLDIIHRDQDRTFKSDQTSDDQNTHHPIDAQTTKSSLVLQELVAQIEALQNKLNINYKKLLLYEAENQKLIQEKNQLYFENKTLSDEFTMTSEKNIKIATYNEELETENRTLSTKTENYDKICAAQKNDLQRLSKFHLKVKNIIKPYVENLKTKSEQLAAENIQLLNTIQQNNKALASFELQSTGLAQDLELKAKRFEAEKTALIGSYEEQIHFLSKEIVEHQQKVLDIQNENLRMKKLTETKHYLDNELIRIKRAHDEMLQDLNAAKIRESDHQNQITTLNTQMSEMRNSLTQVQTEVDQTNLVLESTRNQLAKKLSESEELQLRLRMLEKLNTNLSLNLKSSLDQ